MVDKNSNYDSGTWVNAREIGMMLNVHTFVVYSYLKKVGIKYIKDSYGNGYIDGLFITKHFEELKEFVKGLKNGRKTQEPIKLIAFIDQEVGSQNDWDSKAEGWTKKELYVSYLEEVSCWQLLNQIYRISHYPNGKKALFKWDRSTKMWRYVEEARSVKDSASWLDDISIKYKLCNTVYDVDVI